MRYTLWVLLDTPGYLLVTHYLSTFSSMASHRYSGFIGGCSRIFILSYASASIQRYFPRSSYNRSNHEVYVFYLHHHLLISAMVFVGRSRSSDQVCNKIPPLRSTHPAQITPMAAPDRESRVRCGRPGAARSAEVEAGTSGA